MAELLNGIPTNLTEYPNSFKRQGSFPLEAYSVFYTIDDAKDYASNNPIAYVGQILTVVDENIVKTYVINNEAGELKEIGTGQGTDLNNYFVTPQMFGAVGDGVHDDTNAIQLAFDANLPIVYFPPGRYRTTSKLVCQKPKTIKMCRLYPCNYKKDHPYDDSEDWMGARIETYSPDFGITIGDGVCLDGFSIRAMPGFGGGFIDLSIVEKEYGKTFTTTIGDSNNNPIDVFKYSTVIDLNEGDTEYDPLYKNLKDYLDTFTTGTTSGRGIVLLYDGTLGTATYPSQVRFSHVRVDIAPLLQNNSDSIVPENVYIIPECLFEFRPIESHNYIFEDILLGQNHNRYCDNVFRTVIEEEYYRAVLSEETGTHIWDTGINKYRTINEGEIGTHTLVTINDPWCNNVYIKNMCIEARCDYAINIINNFPKKIDGTGHTAYSWVFEELNIQAYDYIFRGYRGPILYEGEPSVWKRHDNPLNRKYHKSLIKINGMEDLTFIGCCLHDVIQHSVEQGYLEGVFNVDEQFVHMITAENEYDDIKLTGAKLYYDKDVYRDDENEYNDGNTIQNITCVGCSLEFERIETYLSSKIQLIQEKIEEAKTKPSVKSWQMSVESGKNEEGVDGLTLTLQDTYKNTLSSFIPSTPISEEMIDTAVSAWMDEATKPLVQRTNNEINEENNETYIASEGHYSSLIYEDCNINAHIQNWGTQLALDNYNKMWTTHYIPVTPNWYIRIYNLDKETGQEIYGDKNNNKTSTIYSILYFKKSADEGKPSSFSDFLGSEDIHGSFGGSINYFQIPENYNGEQINYVKLSFMPFNYNDDTDPNFRYQALWPGNMDNMWWPEGKDKVDENLMITVTENVPTNITPEYLPYQITTVKLGGLLPTVTAADNGKVLKVVDGKWTAVSHPTWRTI